MRILQGERFAGGNMKLGIDFGTTRIVAAAADRGNYPVIQFDAGDDSSHDWYPPLIAVRGEERLFGWQAFARQEDRDWTVVRSIKKLLSDCGPNTSIEIGDHSWPLAQLLSELAGDFRDALINRSNSPAKDGESLEIYLGVPANANSNQRFLTTDAFRAGGFEVLGMLNEPSAASVEFTHRHQETMRDLTALVVYDLGGGTFDVSLVQLSGKTHTVLDAEGISALGGDDFDDILAEMALDAAGIGLRSREEMTQSEIFRLKHECRQKKEALSPNSRKIVIDLDWVREGWGEAAISVREFYELCQPLVDETLSAVDALLARHALVETGGSGSDALRLASVYVAGGGSELPLVPRGLRERFGRRVRRSAYARSTTAIGLAIQADDSAGYVLRDRLTRYFGVWREKDEGAAVTFDPLFAKETPLPGPKEGPLVVQRSYIPVHDIGHFRYLECSHLTDQGQPTGEITLWDEIRFPFDPALQAQDSLGESSVSRSNLAAQQQIEEAYSCAAGGSLAVTITNHSGGYLRSYQLGRWGGGKVRPAVRRRRPAKKPAG